MKPTPELRDLCIQKLTAAQATIGQRTAFIGLDGFVDEIIHPVDKRQDAENFQRIPTIAEFAQRIAGAAGKSTNIEMVRQQTKLGGNGPIMANAIASFGVQVTYLGALGYPTLHPVFSDFARRVKAITIAEPGYTDALEFNDGKLMFGKMTQLKEVNWESVEQRFGRDSFAAIFGTADLVGYVNWTMLPYLSKIWEAALQDICPTLQGPRRTMFIDLTDPEKRKVADIQHALDLITGFQKYFNVTLGLNEKESHEVSKVLGIQRAADTPEGLLALARDLRARLQVQTVVVHPVAYALAVSDQDEAIIEGPFTPKPFITTGAGDHFNSGFSLGKLLGFNNALSVLLGVATSGHYVRTAESPSIAQLIQMLRNWPA